MAPDPKALGELRSSRARERRDALRRLGDVTPQLRNDLQALRASEPDAWARRVIDRKLGDAPIIVPDEGETVVESSTVGELYARARAEAAEMMAHELRHAILRVERAAEREVPTYLASDSRRAVDGLRSLARSFTQLARAERGSSPVEVALQDLVSECTADLRQTLWPPKLDGPVVVVRCDPDLLCLALVNCVRNAMDASEDALHQPAPVLITWGRTDRDAWVAIHDDGTGVPEDVAELFEPHRTTRGGSGHAGLGLTIAASAMESMGGRVLLEPRQPRGAVCELRWPLEGQ